MIPVQDQPNWFRDNAGALVNNDTSAYDNFLQKKNVAESKHAETEAMKGQINNLNKSVADMSTTLTQILSLLQGSK